MFKYFCKEHDIQNVLIAVRSPQANGQVERYNKTTEAMISKIMHENCKNWNEFLSRVELTCNYTFNRSIKNTLSMLLFGLNQNWQT